MHPLPQPMDDLLEQLEPLTLHWNKKNLDTAECSKWSTHCCWLHFFHFSWPDSQARLTRKRRLIERWCGDNATYRSRLRSWHALFEEWPLERQQLRSQMIATMNIKKKMHSPWQIMMWTILRIWKEPSIPSWRLIVSESTLMGFQGAEASGVKRVSWISSSSRMAWTLLQCR